VSALSAPAAQCGPVTREADGIANRYKPVRILLPTAADYNQFAPEILMTNKVGQQFARSCTACYHNT